MFQDHEAVGSHLKTDRAVQIQRRVVRYQGVDEDRRDPVVVQPVERVGDQDAGSPLSAPGRMDSEPLEKPAVLGATRDQIADDMALVFQDSGSIPRSGGDGLTESRHIEVPSSIETLTVESQDLSHMSITVRWAAPSESLDASRTRTRCDSTLERHSAEGQHGQLLSDIEAVSSQRGRGGDIDRIGSNRAVAVVAEMANPLGYFGSKRR